MNESEVRKLFLVIDNTIGGFSYDDYKVSLWQDLLRDVPYRLAEKNLRAYILNSENRFPPTPGYLAKRPEEVAGGRYIPSASETRLMLQNQVMIEENGTLRPIRPVPMPASLKERLAQLARYSTR